jgi:hypothetical protein
MDNLNEARARAYAEVMREKGPCCFVAVMHDHEAHDGQTRSCLGVAVANEPGYYPVPQFYFYADRHEDAETKADALNLELLEVDPALAFAIQASTMGGRPCVAA